MNYDFYEVLPATISGYVFQDGPPLVLAQDEAVPYIPSVRDGKLTPDDTRLSGVVHAVVRRHRLSDVGRPGQPDHDRRPTPTDTTSSTMLAPGQYSVVEKQPAGYIAGVDTAGSQGGLVVNQLREARCLDPEHAGGRPAGQRDREDFDPAGHRGGAVRFQRGSDSSGSRPARLAAAGGADRRRPRRLRSRRPTWRRRSSSTRRSRFRII